MNVLYNILWIWLGVIVGYFFAAYFGASNRGAK